MRNHGVVDFRLRLPVDFKQEGDWTIASCPVLDVHSQGRSEDEAKRNIIEAIQLFIDSSFERGVEVWLRVVDEAEAEAE
jgi:predicted RNase H-like HicB family nuclease